MSYAFSHPRLSSDKRLLSTFCTTIGLVLLFLFAAQTTAVALGMSKVPLVTGVSPKEGSTHGGTVVTVTGTGFQGANIVWFGTNKSATPTVKSDTVLTVIAPPGEGTVDVRVATREGTSAILPADRFTYKRSLPAMTGISPPPASRPGGTLITVTGISPTRASERGGTLITVTGSGFEGANSVWFGTNKSATPTVQSDTVLTVIAPPGEGTVDVRVENHDGKSSIVAADKLTYGGVPPTVTGISPTRASERGGTLITVTGSGFEGANSVWFGSSKSNTPTVQSDTVLTVIAPPGEGTVDVRVENHDGRSSIVAVDKLTYGGVPPTVTGISPTRASGRGGTLITVTGSGFEGANSVWFGSSKSNTPTVQSDTVLTVIAPPGEGTVDVRVDRDGKSSIVAVDKLTYGGVPPTVTGISPTRASGRGGTLITVTGSGFEGANSVWFGSGKSNTPTVKSDTELTVIAPPGEGTVDVRVANRDGKSSIVAADKLTYK